MSRPVGGKNWSVKSTTNADRPPEKSCLARRMLGWGRVVVSESMGTFRRGDAMLRWAIIFLIIALVAGVLGLFRVQWVASEIAWILFVVFLILFVVSLVLGRRGPTLP